MCFYMLLKACEYRPCRKICLHDAEAFLYLPSPFTDLQNVTNRIVQKIGAHSIQTIVLCLFPNLIFIKIIADGCFFSFAGHSHLSDKARRIVRVSAFFLKFPGIYHSARTFNLCLPNGFLICGILRRIGDYQSLMELGGCIWFLLIEESVLILVRQVFYIYRSIVRDPSKSGLI